MQIYCIPKVWTGSRLGGGGGGVQAVALIAQNRPLGSIFKKSVNLIKCDFNLQHLKSSW